MTACRTFALVLCKNIIYDSKFWNTFFYFVTSSKQNAFGADIRTHNIVSITLEVTTNDAHLSESKHTKFITPFVSKVNYMHYSWHSIYRCFQQPPSVVSMQRRVLLLTVEGANRSIIIRPIFLSHVCTLKHVVLLEF